MSVVFPGFTINRWVAFVEYMIQAADLETQVSRVALLQTLTIPAGGMRARAQAFVFLFPRWPALRVLT